jgi:predicted glycogen debranching enzyme
MKLPAITLNQEAFSRFGEALSKEWLVTNGLGGYASSTVLGVNTRKYHGLLVAALNPPGDRTVCLSKLDGDVYAGGNVYRLGANEFADAVYPQGYTFLDAFSVAPFPTFNYRVGSITLYKTLFMPKNRNAVCVIYKVSSREAAEAKLRIYPLLTCRHFHTIVDRRRNPLQFTQKSGSQNSETAFQNPPATVICRVTDGGFSEKVNWVDGLFYRAEAARGEASSDDCFQPGFFELNLPPKSEKEFAVTAAAAIDGQAAREALDSIGKTMDQVNASFSRELARREGLLGDFYGLHPEVSRADLLSWVLSAADSFIVQDGAGGKAVIAGYHWFEPWGRDTFIALPGLLLVTGRFDVARGILQAYNLHCRDGLIPNYVADETGQPAYNTVDATLWYVNAVLQYLKYTGDYAFVQAKLWSNLQAIISSHQRGTSFGIRLDDDGLLMHGAKLTWMDAATPRAGKAVEVQALWYNALRTMQHLAGKFSEKDLAERYAAMADKAAGSFNGKFWNEGGGCLFDVLEPEGANASLRPNQVFAVSLDYPILDQARWRLVVDVVNRELATPFGLRTLSPSDPKYIGKYVGDRNGRDRAYHNGTIWPWLLGPFITAYLKTRGNEEPARKWVLEKLLLPFFTVGIMQAGLGTLCEICDSDSPHMPRGCIAQAWSVAEPLRAYMEDVRLSKPRFAPAFWKSP